MDGIYKTFVKEEKVSEIHRITEEQQEDEENLSDV